MKTFENFRKTSKHLHENLKSGRDLSVVELASMAYESETNTFPAERHMPADLEDPDAIDEDEVLEDAPANNAGGGAIAGIGVGPQGEPGVPPRKLTLVGPPPSDPRMFQAKIFNRPKPSLGPPFGTVSVTEAMKDPTEMSGAEINKHLDLHDAKDKELTNAMIAAGRGHERPSEYLHPSKTDPLSQALQAHSKSFHALRNEVDRRYGPGAPRRLPKGFGPIKKW